jgi:hypothetical protein
MPASCSTKELEAITGLSAATLREYVRKYGMPCENAGGQGRETRWDLTAVVPWLLAYYRYQDRPKAPSQSTFTPSQSVTPSQPASQSHSSNVQASTGKML